MMYFLKGQLPWQNLKASNKKDKYEKIMEKKISTSIESLCKGYPAELATYLTYVRNLRFDEKPDYAYLKTLLKDLFVKSGFENDYVYDWNLIQKVEAQPGGSQIQPTGQTTPNMVQSANLKSAVQGMPKQP